ncbi:MAG: hypothetical protein ACLQFR_04700 [Streptosporangiaceae bacterium]
MTRRYLAVAACAVGLTASACGLTAARSAASAASRPTHPVLVARLRGADTVAGDFFGTAIAGSGTTIVVGAEDHGRQAGRAYVFARARSGWRQVAELAGSDTRPGDGFGNAVAVSGTTLVVGANGVGGGAQGQGIGRAYVFTRTAAGWRQAAELRAPGAYQGDGFADSVAVSGGTVLVGEDAVQSGAGRVIVYTKGRHGWAATAALRGSGRGSRPVGGFGSVVAMSGGEAIVSARFAGIVYIFRKANSGWRQTAVLSHPRPPGGNYFGQSVAISGRTAAVGAIGNGGRVFVYTDAASGWRRSAELPDPGSGTFDNFGSAVGIAGRVLVATAPGAEANRAGRAYLFTKTKADWRLAAPLPGLQVPVGEFGITAAIWRQTVAVGALGAGHVKGEVYIYRI